MKSTLCKSKSECHPHTVEVGGSNPLPPTTKQFKRLSNRAAALFVYETPNATLMHQPKIEIRETGFEPAPRELFQYLTSR